jgi:hypothetical protein
MAVTFCIGHHGFKWEWFAVLTFLVSLNVTAVFFAFTQALSGDSKTRLGKQMFVFIIKHIWRVIPVIGAIFLFISNAPLPLVLFSIALAPFVFILSFPGIFEKKYYFAGIPRALSLGAKSWGTGIGMFVILSFICSLLFWIGLDWITWIVYDTVDWFIVSTNEASVYFLTKNILEGAIYFIFFNFLIVLFFISANILYFSTVEKEEAHGMFQKLKSFGKQSKVYESVDEGEF